MVAYNECTTPNTTHADPALGTSPPDPSCAPAVQTSDQLTTSTVGKQGAFAQLKAVRGDPGTPEDEADVLITTNATDVRKRSDGTDYVGPVILRALHTDHGPANNPGGVRPARSRTRALRFRSTALRQSPSEPGLELQPRHHRRHARAGLCERGQERSGVDALGRLAGRGPGRGHRQWRDGCAPTCGSGDEEIYLGQGVFTP